jgi:hypothetical protein
LLAGEGADAKHLKEQYLSLIGEALRRHPGLSRESLRCMIERTRARWLSAQKQFPAIPPKA